MLASRASGVAIVRNVPLFTEPVEAAGVRLFVGGLRSSYAGAS
jgi:hypothetical protein